MLEFVRFKERLQQSHTRAVAYCESAVLALSSPPAIPESAVAQVILLFVGLCKPRFLERV